MTQIFNFPKDLYSAVIVGDACPIDPSVVFAINSIDGGVVLARMTDWQLYEKVTFDGPNKLITVNPGVTALNIRTDVYSAWVKWLTLSPNTEYLYAIRYNGLDPIPGGFTGDVYFLINGWKLVVDITKVAISGVLFSDNYTTAYYDANLNPVYAAQVSSVINTVVQNQNVVTGDLSTVPDAVWAAAARSLTTTPGLTLAQFLALK